MNRHQLERNLANATQAVSELDQQLSRWPYNSLNVCDTAYKMRIIRSRQSQIYADLVSEYRREIRRLRERVSELEQARVLDL